MQEYIIKVDRFKSHQNSNGYNTMGKNIRQFKKPANLAYEKDIREQIIEQHHSKYNYTRFTGALSVSFEFHVKIPTTINGVKLNALNRKELAGQWANKKPDLTNIIKTIEDCFEIAGVIDDDMNIVAYNNVAKYYNLDVKEKHEYVKVTIKEVEQPKPTFNIKKDA